MKKINTVTGSVDSTKLGRTLIHEHVVTCCDWSMRMALGGLYYDNDIVMEQAVKKLKEAKAKGITTIVDGTPVNLGRDIRSIIKATELSGVNIIASSGFYHHEEAVAGFKSEDELTELIYEDCTMGMAGTGAIPGILKCAVDAKGFTPYVTKILNVTARVAARTGLPVFCHTIPEIHPGHELLDIFQSFGVNPSSVVLGHHGDIDDIDYLEAVLKKGCYLGLDRFGIESKNPATRLENRVTTLLELCQRGYIKQLLVSHDYAPYTGFWPDWKTVKNSDYFQKQTDYNYFGDVVVPLLIRGGLTESDIEIILAENPRRFLENETKF